MAGSGSNQDVFDVRRIRRLVELMQEYELSEIALQQEDTSIQLRRAASGQTIVSAPAAPVPVAPAPAAPAPAPAAAPAGQAALPANIVEIKSPMVGTFYAAANPDAPPYVKVGDVIGPEKTVCIVEAMKVFNDIPAEVSGKITAILVENGEPVEYGQPLFRVDTQAS